MHRFLVGIYLLSSLLTSSANAEEIRLSAGNTTLDSIINPVKEAFEKETGITIHTMFGTTPFAFKQLSEGDSEAAAVGISFDEMVKLLKVADPAPYRHVILGRGMIHTVVNRANPVSKLSKDQLKGIYTGRITNWKQVGGRDSPIIVILSNYNRATNETFRKIILNSEPFTKEVLELGRMNELREAVEANAEAIAFGSATVSRTGVKRVATPDIFRPITLITKGEPSTNVQKFIDFVVEGPGRELVKE